MNNLFKIVVFLLINFFVTEGINGQNYFKVLTNPDEYLNQKIARFSNGDILVGDSSLESLRTGGTIGKIVLSRLDKCGTTVWSYSYTQAEGYVALKDFKINDRDEIFIYGSFYRELEELVFLCKVNGTTGENKEIRLFNLGTVDHFSFSIDINESMLMIYGLQLDFNTTKLGFVGIFDENLNFQWAKNFKPFDSTGEAIILKDNGFIGRSEAYLVKLDRQGDLDWAGVSNFAVNSGPVEVTGGYIFGAQREGNSFFFKIDEEGQVVWLSDLFAATDIGAAISVLPDGNLLCTYACPGTPHNQLCQLMLSSAGQISKQRRLFIDQSINTGNLYQSISRDQREITIAGNANPFSTTATDVKDYLLQFSLDTLPEDCIIWENFVETSPNFNNLTINLNEIDIDDLELDLVQTINTVTAPFDFPLQELCSESIDPDLLFQDTFLPCGVDWLVHLPDASFTWMDATIDNPRLIEIPGSYKARKNDCLNPLELEYILEKPNCGCSVYLPNAFSPNNDGVNDQLEFFSECPIATIEFIVFDRWGERIFYSNSINDFWDGTHRSKTLPAGVYLVMIQYQWADLDGINQQGQVFQDITLIR